MNIYKTSLIHYVVFLFIAICLCYIFMDGLVSMEKMWSNREEYSHGYLLPLVALFFIWQKKNDLLKVDFNGSWIGVCLTIVGILIGFIGIQSSIYTIEQYGFIVTLYGIILAVLGLNAFSLIWLPLILLFFAIPLPAFLYNNLSQKLQLISSSIGVDVIRLFNISVFLEGNVIDLGVYKLQVVDACSGLRYLFPLMSFGFICAYLFNAPLWQRAIIFITTVPITVLMNSFRIGVIGVLVNYWGIEQAEGFLHDFEGWIIFMACVAILFLEMTFFSKLINKNSRLSDVFGLEVPVPLPDNIKETDRKFNKQTLLLAPIFILSIIIFNTFEKREQVIPDREKFITFPEQIDGWQGKRNKLEKIYLDALTGMSDYIISDYTKENEQINFYTAYYDAQTSGSSIHSPRSCIPGGGWVINTHEVIEVGVVESTGKALFVNRVEIQIADQKQLVYYWFQQRGRILTNEYLTKWYLFYDSITKNRTDGALVRLTTRVNNVKGSKEADKLLQKFALQITDLLPEYIPE
jgi:exosortase D (VPLPA-CTERM-specific)